MMLLSKFFGWIFSIGKDKYLYIVMGALIACLSLIIFSWLPLWANLLISIVIITSSALLKDLVIDDKPDWVDILCTILGGVIVCLPVIIV